MLLGRSDAVGLLMVGSLVFFLKKPDETSLWCLVVCVTSDPGRAPPHPFRHANGHVCNGRRFKSDACNYCHQGASETSEATCWVMSETWKLTCHYERIFGRCVVLSVSSVYTSQVFPCYIIPPFLSPFCLQTTELQRIFSGFKLMVRNVINGSAKLRRSTKQSFVFEKKKCF